MGWYLNHSSLLSHSASECDTVVMGFQLRIFEYLCHGLYVPCDSPCALQSGFPTCGADERVDPHHEVSGQKRVNKILVEELE